MSANGSALLSPASARLYVTIALAAFVNGLLASLLANVVNQTFFGLAAEMWAFLVVWAVTTVYFSYKRAPSGVLGAGLYLLAVLVLLLPVTTYGSLVVAGLRTSDTLDAKLLLEGMRGLVTWGVVAAFVSIVAMRLSRWLTRRGKRFHRSYLDDSHSE